MKESIWKRQKEQISGCIYMFFGIALERVKLYSFCISST